MLPLLALCSALPSSCQPLIQQLQEIYSVTVAVVNLEYEGSVLPVLVRSTFNCIAKIFFLNIFC